MPFEPETRRETWLFHRVNQNRRPKIDQYRRVRYNFVEFDGSPDRYLEPVSFSGMGVLTPVPASIDPQVVVRFEYFNGPEPFELHSLGHNGL